MRLIGLFSIPSVYVTSSCASAAWCVCADCSHLISSTSFLFGEIELCVDLSIQLASQEFNHVVFIGYMN